MISELSTEAVAVPATGEVDLGRSHLGRAPCLACGRSSNGNGALAMGGGFFLFAFADCRNWLDTQGWPHGCGQAGQGQAG